ncbi:MAG: fused MFS/spermidine synthase [Chloroflexi bacterium]|nr:fused MFS/spermidine synthase [Chloroflexota bacterium]MBU1751212.1 fused MFS/spermidine synthase [Chloroflexota bacterium]
MSTMAVEMCASRLLAPYFGTTLIIWANLIGLILIYLTVGYYLGGRLADRFPRETVLYTLVAVAGFAIGLVPFVARPILYLAAIGFAQYSVGLFVGSLVGVLLLFSLPMILLGCVSPFAIRLQLHGVASGGHTAGSIYALSTVGSILGTFLPVLVFIPAIGTATTLLGFAVVLLGVATGGLAWGRAWKRASAAGLLLLGLVILGFVFPPGVVRPVQDMTWGRLPMDLLYEDESAYNYIQVVRWGTSTNLILNEGHAIHSIYDPNQLLTGGPWDYFLLTPFFYPDTDQDDVESLCLLGLAAGTTARQFTVVFGEDVRIDGVEIDPQIIEVGREYFAMTSPNLNAIAQDARYFINTTDQKYDVVGIDVYRQPYIPFQLTTVEFFTEVDRHLTDRGGVVINVGRTPGDDRLVQVLASTMRTVFPSVYIVDIPDRWNSVVFATKQPTQADNLVANLRAGHLREPHLQTVLATALPTLRSVAVPTVRPFTDDWSPVEQVIDLIVLGYMAGGNL